MLITDSNEVTFFYLIEKYKKEGGLNPDELNILETAGCKAARTNFEIYCFLIKSDHEGFKWQWFQRYIMKRINAKFNELIEPEDSYFTLNYDKYYNITHPRLLITMGDQHAKTLICCELGTTWLLGAKLHSRIIYTTYNDTRAKSLYRPVMRILNSSKYRKIFPEFMLAEDIDTLKEGRSARSGESQSAKKITNANQSLSGEKGSLMMSGMNNILGESADYIIADDLLTQSEAYSEIERNNKYLSWTGTVLSRQQKNTKIILTGTWWHPEDIIGMTKKIYIQGEQNGMLEEGTLGWELIEFNSQKDERNYHYDHRKFGEYLWAEGRGHVYRDMKLTNMELWKIKHMNIPSVEHGAVWKEEDFREYKELPCNVQNMIIYISIDPNFKEKSISKGRKVDSCGITIWGLWNKKLYFLDFENVPMGLDTLLNYIQLKQTKYYNVGCNSVYILIEHAANGYGFMQMSSVYGIKNVKVFEVNQYGNKRERAILAHPFFVNNRVLLPTIANNPKIIEYKNELLKFTGDGKTADNLVDSTSQLILDLKEYLIDMKVTMPYLEPISRNEIRSGIMYRANKFAKGIRARHYG